MTNSEIKKLVDYWTKSAQHDYETMEVLFEKRRYSDSLFFSHIVLEKILKAIVAKKTKKQAPYTHNLIFLKELIDLKLNKKEIDLFDRVNQFNIRARYPDLKFEFYKRCNKKFTEFYLEKIKKLYKKICQKIN